MSNEIYQTEEFLILHIDFILNITLHFQSLYNFNQKVRNNHRNTFKDQTRRQPF